jgi:virulence factor Mce-like protein
MSASRSVRLRRDTRMRSGLLVLLAGAVLAIVTFGGGIPLVGGDGGRTVYAELAFAPQLNTKTPVRVGGVDVGRVEEVTVADGGRTARVEMRVTDDDVDLRADATVALRYRTLLGGRFEVALDPGSPSASALSGTTIARDRTRSQVEVDDILRVYDRGARTGQRTMLRELAAALDGPHAGGFTDALAPTLRPVPDALRELRGRAPDDLSALVRSSARTVGALDRNAGALGRLVRGADVTLRTTAAARESLGRGLRETPAALAATRAVARDIDATLPEVDGLVADLRPAAAPLLRAARATRPTAVALDDLLTRARPLLTSLRPALGRLGSAAVTGRRVVAAAAPVVRRLDEEIVPYLASRDDDLGLRVHELIGPTIASLGSITSEFDELGYLAHFPIQPTENSLSLVPCTTALADPTAAQKLRCDGLEELLGAIIPGGTP